MNKSVLFFLCALCMAGVAPAMADALEEIVVRADYRQRTLAELPASISVMDRETVEDIAVAHFVELAEQVPNLNYAGGSNRPRYFQIRGTGERSQYEGAPNPSVGFLVDGIDFSAIGGIALSWDIEQVEVLRGPQGTRYGANALAGLINVESVAPRRTRDARIRLAAGDNGLTSIGGAIGGGLGSDMAWRLSALNHRADGFHRNRFVASDSTNGVDETELRARLRYEPATDWSVDLTGFFVDADNGYDAFAIDNSYDTESDRPGRDAQESLAGSIAVSYTGNRRFDIASLSSVARSDIVFSFDADWGNAAFWSPYVYDFISRRDRIRETMSQEIRLASPRAGGGRGAIGWVAGVYALKLREDLKSVDSGLYVDPLFGAFEADTRIASDYSAVNSAVFGEIDVALSGKDHQRIPSVASRVAPRQRGETSRGEPDTSSARKTTSAEALEGPFESKLTVSAKSISDPSSGPEKSNSAARSPIRLKSRGQNKKASRVIPSKTEDRRRPSRTMNPVSFASISTPLRIRHKSCNPISSNGAYTRKAMGYDKSRHR